MIKRAFFFGMLFMVCLLSLFQDFMGKDKYIEYANTHWVSGWIGIPIAVLGLSISINWLLANREN